MQVRATLDVDEASLLAFYNDKHYDETPIEEVEEYVGNERPFTKADVNMLVEYHLLDENEFVYVDIQK